MLRQVRDLIIRVWCGQVDAEPGGQYVGAVAEFGGLMRYIALHFQKESQSPPAGFRGQRFNCSRDYFTGRTRAECREDARLALREKRELWKLGQHTGLTGDELEDAYEAKLAAEGFPEWGLHGSKRPIVAPLKAGEAPHVPRELLEAAFRWVDERSIIDEAREEVRTHGASDQLLGPPISVPAGQLRLPVAADAGAVGAAAGSGRSATSTRSAHTREEVTRDGQLGTLPGREASPDVRSSSGNGAVAERPEAQPVALPGGVPARWHQPARTGPEA